MLALALIWIAVASYQDLKTTVVNNWVSFSLIIFAMGFRFFYSLFSANANGFWFFYQGLIGLAIFFVIENLFYYGRVFAGGDAKLMLALGAILPFSESFLVNIKIFFWFFASFLFFGAIYGMLWSLYYAIKNHVNFGKEFKSQFRKNRTIIYSIMIVALVLMFLGFYIELFFILGIFLFLIPYLFLYAKAVDGGCMVVKVLTKNLIEGDWLNKDVRVGRETIKSNWEGVSLSEIKKLKKIKYVWIKRGIPFVPVFLFSFIALIYLWQSGLWNSFW